MRATFGLGFGFKSSRSGMLRLVARGLAWGSPLLGLQTREFASISFGFSYHFFFSFFPLQFQYYIFNNLTFIFSYNFFQFSSIFSFFQFLSFIPKWIQTLPLCLVVRRPDREVQVRHTKKRNEKTSSFLFRRMITLPETFWRLQKRGRRK